MAFLENDFGGKYLSDFYNDRIPQGLGIGIEQVDNHLSFKQGQYNILIGVDNVGKTDFVLWYFLVHAIKHNKVFDIWSGENKSEQQKRKIIQFFAGQKLKDISYPKVLEYKRIIEKHFNFIDRNKTYTHKDLLNLSSDTGSHALLIDPINGLSHKEQFGTTASTYKISNDIRQFCNHTNKSVFVNGHTVTEASRRVYPKEHELAGYQMPPIKSMIEGGQPYASRADDFWIINRLINHEQLKWFTQLEIQKVKDTETGGSPTMKDKPLCFEYNNGLGYKWADINILNSMDFGGVLIDPLEGLRPKKIIIHKEPNQVIKPNLDFDSNLFEQKEKMFNDKILPIDENIDPF